MSVPKLRFKEFSGEWGVKKLGELSKVYDGTHMTPDYKESGVPFYSVEHLTNNDFFNTKFISEDVFEKENKRVTLEKGDILMTRIGDIGTPKYISWDVRASFYVSLALIKNQRKINSLYLSHFISSPYFQKELHQRTIHVAFPKKINLGEISECFVKSPCESEQTKIANLLTAVDEKITLLTQKADLLSQYKKGVMQQIFSQELRFKDDDGQEFPEWEEASIGSLFIIKAGGDIASSNVSSVKTDIYTYPIFSNSEKNLGLFGYTDEFKINTESITVTGRGTLGIAIPRYAPYYPIVRLLSLIPKLTFNVYFGASAINMLNVFIESTGVPQLTAPQISDYVISFPSLPEQNKIANFLTAIDEKITNNQTQLNAVKQYKQGLLQQMFV